MEVPRFWRETRARYNLEGVKCGACEKVFFPPREVCPDCHRESIGRMDKFSLSGKGEVFSYSVIHDAPDAFKAEIPYVIALIQTDEGPMVTGQIVDREPGEIAIGSRVETVFRKISEEGKHGIIHYGFKFRVVKPGTNDLTGQEHP